MCKLEEKSSLDAYLPYLTHYLSSLNSYLHVTTLKRSRSLSHVCLNTVKKSNVRFFALRKKYTMVCLSQLHVSTHHTRQAQHVDPSPHAWHGLCELETRHDHLKGATQHSALIHAPKPLSDYCLLTSASTPHLRNSSLVLPHCPAHARPITHGKTLYTPSWAAEHIFPAPQCT